MKISLLLSRLLCFVNLALSLNMYGQSTSQSQLSSSSWYKQAVAGIESREYYFHRFSGGECFVAANHGQYLGFQFTPAGYTVKNFHDDGAASDLWQQHFSLQSIGRPGSARLHAGQPIAICRDTSLQYVYRNYTIEYVNDRRGMRQNFIVRRRPEGPGRR